MPADPTPIRDLLRNLRDDCGHHDAPETREEAEAALAALDALAAERDEAQGEAAKQERLAAFWERRWRKLDDQRETLPPKRAPSDMLATLGDLVAEPLECGHHFGCWDEEADRCVWCERDEACVEVERLRADLHAIWTTCTGVVSTHADGPDADNIPRRVEEMREEVERLRRLALVPMSGPPESEGDYIVARPYSDGTTGAVVVRVEDYCCPTIGGSELHVSEAGSGDMIPVQHTEDRFIFRVPVEVLEEVADG